MLNGLRNLGNTCFMNSGLQIFLNCTYFNNKLLKYKKLCKSELFTSYIKLVKDYNSNNGCILSPNEFKMAIDKRYPLFRKFGQEDIYEFMTLFLSAIYDDLVECGVNNKDTDKDVIKNVLGINCTIFIKPIDKNIKLIHKNKSSEYVLHLELDSNYEIEKPTELEDLIINLTLPKKIGIVGFDKPNKEICNLEAIRTTKIDNCSQCMIIYLGRYKEVRKGNNFSYQKLHNKIKIPKIIEGSSHNYHLRSFALHHGNSNGGHYVSYVNNNGIWYNLNDSNCSIISEKDALYYAMDAYVICYQIEL